MGAAEFDLEPSRVQRMLYFLIVEPRVEGWNLSQLARATGLNSQDANRYVARLQQLGILEFTRVSDRKRLPSAPFLEPRP